MKNETFVKVAIVHSILGGALMFFGDKIFPAAVLVWLFGIFAAITIILGIILIMIDRQERSKR